MGYFVVSKKIMVLSLVLITLFSNDLFIKMPTLFLFRVLTYFINSLGYYAYTRNTNLNMHHENNTLEDLSSSHNQVELHETERTMTTASSEISTLGSSVSKTARDRFFEDLKYENDKNRWLAKRKICVKPKQNMDKIGVTSDYAWKYHVDQCLTWLDELKKE